MEQYKQLCKEVLENGKAFEKLKEFIAYQGGDTSYLDDLDKFDKAKYVYEIVAKKEGYIHNIKALDLGVAAMKLGAGRATKDDIIDHSVGIVLHKKVALNGTVHYLEVRHLTYERVCNCLKYEE